MLPLMLVFLLVAVLLVIVAADAASVHLQRQHLIATSDAAALAAANALDEEAFYSRGQLDALVPLSDATVRESVGEYLAAARAAQAAAPGEASAEAHVQVGEPTGSPDGMTAEVTLTAPASLPIPVPDFLAPGDLTLSFTSRARTHIRQ